MRAGINLFTLLVVTMAGLVEIAGGQPTNERVISIAWSPDNTKIALGYSDGTLQIAEVASNTIIATQQFTGEVISIDWNPVRVNQLAVGVYPRDDTGSSVYVYQYNGSQITATFEAGTCVKSVKWNSNGTYIAAATNALSNWNIESTVVRVWDVTAEKLITTTLTGNSRDQIDGIDWSPDDAKLIGYSANEAIIWDSSTGDEILRLLGHSDQILDVAWSPDIRYVATSSQDLTINIWESNTGEVVQTISAIDLYPYEIEWHPTANVIAANNIDSIMLWDTSSVLLIQTIKVPGGITDLSFSPDGAHLAIANGASATDPLIVDILIASD